MRRVLHPALAIAMALGWSGQLLAARKSLDSYWKEVGLKFSVVEGEVTSENCYADERTFLACIYAVNAVLSFQPTPVSLVANLRLENESGFGTPVHGFAAASVVTPKKLASQNPIELYEQMKKEREATNASWSAVYQSRGAGQPVSFEDVLAYAKQSPRFAEKEYLITAVALNTLLAVVRDPHTMYLPAAYVQDQSSGGSDDFTGIGVTIRTINQGGHKVVVIQSPIEGGPALKAGLHANDVLVEVDGVQVEGLSSEELSARIQGPAGKALKITVNRKGQRLTFDVVRAKISVPNVASKMMPGTEVGYVKLASFVKQDGCEKLQAAVSGLEEQGAKALLLDLRDNPGGLLVQAVCVANIFLDKGEAVVSTESTSPFGGNREFATTENRQTALPLVTLINARSASASELVAGALQDHRRAFLVGERSFGKGTVQSQTPAAGGRLVLRRTIARFFLPSGRTNQIEGVHPDIETFKSPNPTREDKFAMREEDEYMAYPPTGPKWQQPRPEAVAKLRECAATQGKALSDFNGASEAAIAPDFQLLTAVDVANCAVTTGVGSADEPHPEFRARPLDFRWGVPARDLFSSIRGSIDRALNR